MPVYSKSPTPAERFGFRDRPRRLRCFLRVRMESAEGFSGSVRVRNLSAQGMGAISGHAFRQGEPVTVAVRNIGKVPGRVMWCRNGAFGVQFDQAIDPEVARKNQLDDESDGDPVR